MLYMRYIVGGQAALSAAETLSLDDMATGQEGGTITCDRVRVVHKHLIEAMWEMKIDEASIAEMTWLSAEARQAKGMA